MQKTSSKAFSIMLVLMLALTASLGSIQPAHAVVGSVSTPITKAIQNVNTRYYFTGYGWTAGAPFWYKWGTTTTWIGTGVATGFSADSGGAIPSTACIDLTATTLDTWYILLSQSSDGTAGVAAVTMTVKSTGPSFTIGAVTGTPGDTIEDVIGSGFTPGQSVTLYIGNKALTTLSVGTDGRISGTFVVPEIARPATGTYGVWAVQTDGISPQYGTTGRSCVDFIVTTSVTTDRISIRGQGGETFVLTGHGFVEKETVSNPMVAGVTEQFQPVTPSPTVGADGTFTATVYLTAPISTYGPVTIYVTGSTSGSQSFANAIIISTPDYMGDEGIALSDLSRKVGESTTIRLWNWPSGGSITINLGGLGWTTTGADGNGAAKIKIAVPETFGGVTAVTATAIPGMATSSLTVNPDLDLFYADTGATAYSDTDSKRPYVKKNRVLKLVATGLAASTEYSITDGTTDLLVGGGWITGITKGTLKTNTVKTTALGSIELTYKARSSTTTGTDVTVSVGTAVNAQYNGLGDPTLTITPNHGSTTSSWTVTITADNIIPATVYQILFAGVPQVLGAGPDNYFSATGTLGGSGSAPAGTTIMVPVNTSPGVCDVVIVYFGQTASLAKTRYIASTAAGTATITTNKALAAANAYYGDSSVVVFGYNFAASETGVTLRLAGTAISAPATVEADGSFRLTLITSANYINLPGGSYIVFADRTSGTEPWVSLNVVADIAITPDADARHLIGDTITYSLYSLAPNSRYVMNLDTAATSIVTITTDQYGYKTGTFAVPALVPGDYALAVASEATPTTAIATKTFKMTARVVSDLATFGVDPVEAIPMQLVRIKWTVAGLTSQLAQVKVFIRIGDFTIYAGDTSYDGSNIRASFWMPNGPAGTLKLTVTYADYAATPVTDTAIFAIKRISGTGSLVVGVDLAADLAYVKTKVDTVALSLSSLDAKIVAVNGTIVTLSTKIGTLSTDVSTINTKVTSVSDGVAKVTTDLGTLSGKVTSVDGKVTTIATDVGTLKTGLTAVTTAVTDAKNAALGAQSAAAAISTPLYGAIVLALVAAIASIVAVVTLQRKLAG